MKKNLLIVLGAIVFVALNVLAFSAVSVYAHDPMPVTHGDCYQTMSSCSGSGAQYMNCSSRKTNQYCSYTHSNCNPCSDEPIFFDPNDGPVVGPVGPVVAPERPGEKYDPNAGSGKADFGSGEGHYKP